MTMCGLCVIQVNVICVMHVCEMYVTHVWSPVQLPTQDLASVMHMCVICVMHIVMCCHACMPIVCHICMKHCAPTHRRQPVAESVTESSSAQRSQGRREHRTHLQQLLRKCWGVVEPIFIS